MENNITFKEFFNKYAQTFNRETNKIEKISLFEFQNAIIDIIENDNITYFLKSRQMFCTTLMSYYITWKFYINFLNKEKYKIGVMGCNNESGVFILKNVREILSRILPNVLPTINNIKMIIYNDINSIKVVNGVNGLCSNEFDLFYIDEGDFIKDIKIIKEMLETQSKKIIFISSYSSNESFLNNIFESDNNYSKHKIHYTINPLYNKERIEELRKSMLDKFDIEYELIYDENKLEELIQFRITKKLKNKILLKLTDNNKISDYIRGLIINDLRT